MSPDERTYGERLEPHRRELHAHCYRMLGSVQDAEDAVQETLVRAWRGLESFEGRSSLRSWLYTIATNVCLRAIERRPVRVLPVDYGPQSDPHAPFDPPLVESTWIEPYPDAELGLLEGLAAPDARYEQREAVELAFIAALQRLPARQRAVLILRDVLGFSAAEVAATLQSTPASVYSLLQRAHASLDGRLPERSQQATLRALGNERLRAIVDRYVQAWTENDVDAIVGMLTDSAVLAMPPIPGWFRGRDAVGAVLSRPLDGRHRWRLLPTWANGQPAFGAYRRRPSGVHLPHSVAVLTFESGRIGAITSFHDRAAPERFGLPARV
ncbi:MAG TPA: sigma-70 family RNA polymerase sigma factor [Solirubrobacteraceae bacterium]|jgi:RNA polymerase sigma-70 factor (ECF subfamily)|nr:sigma-70 family RNA polymerase sigma factor [Solirubrobacteraceae bacterium]